MRRVRRGGFTLVEILAVVSIIAVLAAVLLPVIAGARDAGRRAYCLSNLKQIALAHQMYVADHDDLLPSWFVPAPKGYQVWPDYLRLYYGDAGILDEGSEERATDWVSDYTLCAWGPGGRGTREDPYWRWPGSVVIEKDGPRRMRLTEVLRPVETMQFADGVTTRAECYIRLRHRNGVLNGAFLDGHAQVVSDTAWHRVDRGERGYFYRIAAADR